VPEIAKKEVDKIKDHTDMKPSGYVTVYEIRYKDGQLKPVYLVWEDGIPYKYR